jgi:Cu+-exporting ATPase
MFRRREFIRGITAAGAGLTASGSGQAGEVSSVTFEVQGFTCVTCAIGLEVVLREQQGVKRAKASYKERKVVVGYDATCTSPQVVQAFINKTTGFTAVEKTN